MQYFELNACDEKNREGNSVPIRADLAADLKQWLADKLADIQAEASQRGERGRTIDVHALRTTFGTLLSWGGVSLRTTQAAMRHSDPSLTANVYTDPKLLDIGGALDALPALPLNAEPSNAREQARALKTGTCDTFPLAPLLAPTGDQRGQTEGNPGKTKPVAVLRFPEPAVAVSAYPDNEKRGLTASVRPLHSIGPRRFELLTSSTPS